ncbi:MAG TPA: hypothetical protein VGZ91_13125 [Candidatus Sulfotelmatobacter sp.]|nr:hypothetical protein [Candidatus Sulfotelmatobacter sp.]
MNDEHLNSIGMLLTCKGDEYDLGKFGAAHLAAYLLDTAPGDYGQPGKFSSDYLLVRKERLKEYKESFMHSSAIWGGFWHAEGSPVLNPPAARTLQPITACTGIKLPTPLHMAAAKRSAMMPYAFERYLKLYHLLELSFDYETVKRIKDLKDDLHGIGQIFSQHRRDEFERLKQLMIEKCSNRGAVASCIEDVCRDRRFDGTTRSIFFDFGKAENPLLEKQTEFEQMVKGPGFNKSGAEKSGVISHKARPDVFETLVLKTAAYWIYRVRCSIAHNRIGEYVIKPQDEEFVEQFAERLLRQVLATVLR